jgi:hypothetical protein
MPELQTITERDTDNLSMDGDTSDEGFFKDEQYRRYTT